MAYGFVPRGDSWGGSLGGFGSLGMGAGLANALGVGLNLADGFRRYQNNVYLDPMRLRSQRAGFEADYAGNKFQQGRYLSGLSTLIERDGMSADPGPWNDQELQRQYLELHRQLTQTDQPMGLQMRQQPASQNNDPAYGGAIPGLLGTYQEPSLDMSRQFQQYFGNKQLQ
ncbi:hypothetical protein PSI23_11060 [Xenorhabdus sp. XENO-10]|uniref:Uncharacterized protein n=1 Tax=Xenorhabdus yunnanensis TaxID=3025878 RepID=A0ABT5LFE4_9GAMM|nr:hypothetical protein [Xenorhabdus yunnanensis]MDC9589822.1 hypothetical protein [Xenorhabdus yunnanensis]